MEFLLSNPTFIALLYELEAIFKQIALFLFSINSPVFDIPF